MTITKVYEELRGALGREIRRHNLSEKNITVRTKALSAEEAIGKPDRDDYPIIKGKEVMVEAVFEGVKGQAFTDEYENANYRAEDLLKIELNTKRKIASFISGFNAIFRYLDLCDKTIHCRDAEPKICASNLSRMIASGTKVLLVGFQPGFIEFLASSYNVRVADLDHDNIGRIVYGIRIEPPEMTSEAIRWCDLILATGSTIINGSIIDFLNLDKPVLFYGVSISATAKVLDLKTYCHCGH